MRDETDDADAIPKAIVVDPGFDWEDDRPPATPWNETLIYEVHVKGFTQAAPGRARGPARHLRRPGVRRGDRPPALARRDGGRAAAGAPQRRRAPPGRARASTNYWGYSSIGFFAPHAQYAATGRTGEQVREFKGMVKALHRAGIEVILDVVYNHTAEGNHMGPMLSFKGIDNLSYYRCSPEDPRYYVDFTGTGNSLNPVHPSVLRLIMDSLRYWVLEMHVDGFRFDLASALAREFYDVNRLSAFFDIIHQDPVLSQVKLIAEPWDVGPGGYQVGNFPVLWTEWNGLYRDEMRDFWRGAERRRGRVRLAADRLERPLPERRPPPVRLDQLHHRPRRLHAARPRLLQRQAQRGEPRGQPRRHRRQPQLELRRRGADRRPARSRELRQRQQRNFLATLLLSQGVPMLLGGDEMGRTQDGNNNAYCQDNEISWFDWELDDDRRRLLEFTRRLIDLRRAHPVFHRRDFFGGTDGDGSGLPGHPLVPRRRARDEPPRLAPLRPAQPRGLPERRGDAEPRPERRAGGRRLVRAAGQRRPRGRALPPAGAPLRQPLAPGDLDGRAGRARGLAQLAGALRGAPRPRRSLVLLRRTW